MTPFYAALFVIAAAGAATALFGLLSLCGLLQAKREIAEQRAAEHATE